MACYVNIFWNLKKMYPGYLLEIGLAGLADTLIIQFLCRCQTVP